MKTEVNQQKKTLREKIPDALKRITCLLLPVISAFGGYFLSPRIWILLNKNTAVPEIFRFICTVVAFLIPSLIIFIETRKLNPIIKIAIKD